MKKHELNELHRLLELKFKDRQKAFSEVVAAEQKLRAEVSRLDKMASATSRVQDGKMRAIGADVIWNAWLGRTKTGLNMELAQVLAQKDKLIRRVRKDYGKVLASEAMAEAQKVARSKHLRSQELSETLGQHLQPSKINDRDR